MSDRPNDILIIGGGLAGLAAAHTVIQRGERAIILEAGPALGGRCRQVTVGGIACEAGAEFFHGGDSVSKKLADAMQMQTERVFTAAHGDGGPDDAPAPDGSVAFYHVDGKTLSHDSASLSALNAATAKLSELPVVEGSERRSIAEYLREEGVREAPMLELAAASYSNTLGVGDALESLPLRAVVDLERRWQAADGDGDYRATRPLSAMCEYLAKGAVVHVDSPVAHLDVMTAGSDGLMGVRRLRTVTATCVDGRRFHGVAAIVATPLPVLQRGILRFSPPLPPDKVSAIGSIAMREGVKLLLVFERPPWTLGRLQREEPPPEVHSVITAGQPGHVVPEIWFRHTSAGEWVASGFATGEYASALAAMGEAEAVKLMLCQLSRVLPTAGAGSGERPSNADALHRQLRASRLIDWTAESYIMGAYSAPSFGEFDDARALYRRTECGGLLGFCGEATESAMMTMSAALSSGHRAAAEVLTTICASSMVPRVRDARRAPSSRL